MSKLRCFSLCPSRVAVVAQSVKHISLQLILYNSPLLARQVLYLSPYRLKLLSDQRPHYQRLSKAPNTRDLICRYEISTNEKILHCVKYTNHSSLTNMHYTFIKDKSSKTFLLNFNGHIHVQIIETKDTLYNSYFQCRKVLKQKKRKCTTPIFDTRFTSFIIQKTVIVIQLSICLNWADLPALQPSL